MQAKIGEIEARLEASDSGRVLVRESGTEPVIRVMVEAETEEEARTSAEDIAGLIRRKFGVEE